MPITNNQISEKGRAFLLRVDAAIIAQMQACDVSSQAVAACLCITSQQLRRKLKSVAGVTSYSYISNFRIDYAKKLLASPEMLSIAEVSRKCGFTEPGNFARTFKEVTGMTPTQFVHQNE